MNKKLITLLVGTNVLLIALFLMSATGVLISNNTGSPDASAALEIRSTDQGFLPPRMTTTQRNNISSPAEGLVIYNTTTDGLEMYSGSAWGSIGGGSDRYTILKDIKSSGTNGGTFSNGAWRTRTLIL